MKVDLTGQGNFSIGCNYWASHAGTAMWSDWRPETVEKDLKQLSEAGLNILRVFPLWPDFQPLNLLRTCGGAPREFRMGEAPLPETEAGRAGVSEEMMARFKFFADKAEENGIKLLVGILTGWMSGRLFVPPAFEGLNVLTDPSVIIWEVRFVKYFVKYFKEHPAITGWDLGNECNCMGCAESRESAWIWASQISNAIKSVDLSRPVVSGMHGLKAEAEKGKWLIEDQAEITDVLTTHPYPRFTPYCALDPINELRNGLHATAESCMYADIGGKPCIVEEIGVLGPMTCSDQIAADYARAVLFSSWAHDLRSFQWWCAYDQNHLKHAPYDWNAIERCLGLFRNDRFPKPIVEVYSKFRAFLEAAPVLPERIKDAVCILSRVQDQWGAAYSSFILAKQAGFDIDFQYIEQPLKDSDFYLIPSVDGQAGLPAGKWREILAKVKDGATLYISLGDAVIEPFNEPFGVELQTTQMRRGDAKYKFKDLSFASGAVRKFNLKNLSAEILATEEDGNPVFIQNKHGKGAIYFLAFPIEQELSETSGAFHDENAQPLWEIYKEISGSLSSRRVASKNNPCVGITEHVVNENERIMTLINYSSQAQKCEVSFSGEWRISKSLYGASPEDGVCCIPANDAVVLLLKN